MSSTDSKAPRRALIVIDVQKEYFTGGSLLIEYPPVEQTLPNIGRAMDVAQAAGIPVVVVQHSEAASVDVRQRLDPLGTA